MYTTYAFFCLLSIAMTGSKDSPPPIIADLVPRHNQIVELNRSSGSTSIDDNKVFAKKLLGEVLANQRAALMEGKDGDVALLEIINEKNLRVDHVHKYTDLRSFYGMEESHKAMIVSEDEENTCLVFTCMQIASAIASPANAHRLGNCAIVFFFTNGFVHSSCLREHQGITSFLPSPPRNNRYCINFLRKMDVQKSLHCFMKTRFFLAVSNI